MIMDYPQLVKYFASSNPIQLLIFIMPLWGITAYKLSTLSFDLVTLVLGLFAGVLYWTFLEYAIHRFAYHTHFKNKLIFYFLGSFHLYHHKDMSDHRILNAGFLIIYAMTPTVLLPFYLLIDNQLFLYSMVLGLSGSYYAYECVHYLLHYKHYTKGYLGFIQDYHMHHHDKNPNKNFGNTSQLWDVLLGTYDAGYKSYAMSEKTKATLITSSSEKYNPNLVPQSQN